MTERKERFAQSVSKILVLATAWFPPKIGGEANILQKISEYSSSVNLVYLAENLPGADEFDSSFPNKVHRLKFYSRSENIFCRIIRLLEIALYILLESPDVILVGNGRSGFLVQNALKILRKKIPYVILIHGTELLEIKKNSAQLEPYKESSLIIANSDYTKSLATALNIPSTQVKVIRPGCDPHIFCPSLETLAHKKKLGLAGQKIILTVGSLVKRKGQDMVIRALGKVIKDIPNIHYLIVGTGVYKKELEDITAEKEMDSHVTFLGYVEDSELPSFYNLCDLFIMPSREALGTVEGLGMVFIEASACGKPCIGGNSGGVGEAVVHGKTGLLVDPYDESAIANAIVNILGDEKKAASYGMAGRKMVENEFSWNYYYNNLIVTMKEQIS